MKRTPENRGLRSFGLTVGGILVAVGIWPMAAHDEALRWWALIPGGILVTLGAGAPGTLVGVHHAWMKLGHVLGWVNTRIILGVVFYTIITPLGLFMRWLGRDPMRRGFAADLDTYRVVRECRPPSHLNHQF